MCIQLIVAGSVRREAPWKMPGAVAKAGGDGEVGRLPWKAVVRLAGIEPTTLGFGGQYSIH
jgi:hypothetical protein